MFEHFVETWGSLKENNLIFSNTSLWYDYWKKSQTPNLFLKKLQMIFQRKYFWERQNRPNDIRT